MSSKEWFRAYYLRNREKYAQQAKERYLANRDEILARRKAAKYHLTPQVKTWQKEYRIRNKAKVKLWADRSLMRCQYGIELEDFNRMVEEQKNRCAICRKKETAKPRLSVDHNHVTKKVRGLLCHACNCAIGLMKESKTTLLNALRYLEQYE